MAKNEQISTMLEQEYQHGFITDIEVDTFPPGLDEDVIRKLSAIKGEPEFMLAWRLKGLVCIILRLIIRLSPIILHQKT